jgi:hypothetical protein
MDYVGYNKTGWNEKREIADLVQVSNLSFIL